MAAISKEFAISQTERLETFEGFPRFEFAAAAFMEYVNALIRCQSEQQCREVVTHFVETATKYPTVAVVLAQIRITAPPTPLTGKSCSKCVDGWMQVHVLVEAPKSKPQEISKQEADELMERIIKTRGCRSMVYSAVRWCGCFPMPAKPFGMETPKSRGAAKQPTFSDFVK
jgi:hypothetical protein